MTQLIATNQLTLTNVNDGAPGPKGDTGSILGENKWIGRKYSYLGSTRIYPSFDHINGLNPIATEIFDDSTQFSFWDDYYIAHFQSNLYVNIDKQITTTVTHDDDLTIYCNDEVVVSKNTTIFTPYDITFNLKAGWNKIDILLHEIAGGDRVTFGTSLSSLVDHLSYIKGADGVGVSNVKSYFILSNTPTGVVRTSGTWSTTPLTPTLSQKYVWTYLETTLSNGTKQYSEPYITGVYGDKGDQGIPGPPGKDGLPTYIHWAYSDNADGTGLTTSDNGQRYIGQYSDNIKTDSTDKTKYRWADRWAKIYSGGRNYFKNSRSREYIITSVTTQDFRTLIYDEFWKNDRRFIKSMVRISLDVTFSPALPQDISTWVHFNASPWYGAPITFKGGTTGRQHFDLVYDLSGATNTYKTNNVFIRFNNRFPLNTKVYIDNANLYISSVREDYRPALEELEEALDSKADQALTQQQINALNEKNQILEAEMKAKASMEAFSELEKTYKSFVKANADGQAKAEADLVEAGRRIEMLTTQFGGLAELKTFIDTYMSSSNEGLIIGKNDASSTIKVSSDRISMFSAGKEVMYISQGVININNGIFTVSVQIGKFRTEQYHLNADMNVIRYVG